MESLQSLCKKIVRSNLLCSFEIACKKNKEISEKCLLYLFDNDKFFNLDYHHFEKIGQLEENYVEKLPNFHFLKKNNREKELIILNFKDYPIIWKYDCLKIGEKLKEIKKISGMIIQVYEDLDYGFNYILLNIAHCYSILELLDFSESIFDDKQIFFLLSFLKNCCNLKISRWNNCQNIKRHAASIFQALQTSKKTLRQLEFCDCQLNSVCIQDLLNLLEGCQKITHFKFGKNPDLGSHLNDVLFTLERFGKDLEELDLSECLTTVENVNDFYTVLKSCKKLQLISFGLNSIHNQEKYQINEEASVLCEKDYMVKDICKQLALSFQTLSKIYYENTIISLEQSKIFGDLLAVCPAKTCLKFKGFIESENNFNYILKILQVSHEFMQEINLLNCNLVDLKILASYFKYLGNLKSLKLSCPLCHIEYDSIVYFFNELISQCKRLKKFQITSLNKSVNQLFQKELIEYFELAELDSIGFDSFCLSKPIKSENLKNLKMFDLSNENYSLLREMLKNSVYIERVTLNIVPDIQFNMKKIAEELGNLKNLKIVTIKNLDVTANQKFMYKMLQKRIFVKIKQKK